MNWDNFDFVYDCETTDLLRCIVGIEASKQAVLNLVLPPDWQTQLNKLNRVRAVHGTTALEGNPLSEAEVSHQIDLLDKKSDETGPKITKEQLQIRNAEIAQNWVPMRFGQDTAPISCEDVLKLHYMVTRDADTEHNTPGAWRGFGVQVGSDDLGGVHIGAPHKEIPKLMAGFCHFVNSPPIAGHYPVIKALLAHFFLVTIHPFGDGNGRVSRLIEAGILFQQGYNVHGFYGLSNYFYRNERSYKIHLQKSRKSQPFNVTEFIRFGLTGFEQELQGINNFIKMKLNRVVYRNMLVGAFNKRVGDRRRLLNQREYNLLIFLITATEPMDPFSPEPSRKIKFSELREDKYVIASYKDVTPRTFYRELIRLGQMGFISFTKEEAAKDWILELDYRAIGKY